MCLLIFLYLVCTYSHNVIIVFYNYIVSCWCYSKRNSYCYNFFTLMVWLLIMLLIKVIWWWVFHFGEGSRGELTPVAQLPCISTIMVGWIVCNSYIYTSSFFLFLMVNILLLCLPKYFSWSIAKLTIILLFLITKFHNYILLGY